MVTFLVCLVVVGGASILILRVTLQDAFQGATDDLPSHGGAQHPTPEKASGPLDPAGPGARGQTDATGPPPHPTGAPPATSDRPAAAGSTSDVRMVHGPGAPGRTVADTQDETLATAAPQDETSASVQSNDAAPTAFHPQDLTSAAGEPQDHRLAGVVPQDATLDAPGLAGLGRGQPSSQDPEPAGAVPQSGPDWQDPTPVSAVATVDGGPQDATGVGADTDDEATGPTGVRPGVPGVGSQGPVHSGWSHWRDPRTLEQQVVAGEETATSAVLVEERSLGADRSPGGARTATARAPLAGGAVSVRAPRPSFGRRLTARVLGAVKLLALLVVVGTVVALALGAAAVLFTVAVRAAIGS